MRAARRRDPGITLHPDDGGTFEALGFLLRVFPLLLHLLRRWRREDELRPVLPCVVVTNELDAPTVAIVEFSIGAGMRANLRKFRLEIDSLAPGVNFHKFL
jgi:hypothetical protein